MITSAKLQVQLIVDGCKRIGVKHVVLSPGSRNAPLSIAFDEDEQFEVTVVTDERSAAFVALGMAQLKREPVAIACTSGTAALNYYPAIAEAFYQEIPLIVLTADRPAEWVDQGDGQTIRQTQVYDSMVLKSATVPEMFTDEHRWSVERTLSEVLQMAVSSRKGPVHLNVPFSEPLYETSTSSQIIEKWTTVAACHHELSSDSLAILTKTWQQSTKRLIIVGQMHPSNGLKSILENIALDGSVAVLVEHTSNCFSPYFISTIDRTLSCIPASELEQYNPDLIVSIGGAIVSKRVKTFLRNSKAVVVRFGESFPMMDTYQNLAFTAQISPETGLKILANFLLQQPKVSNFGFTWNKLNYYAGEKHIALTNQLEWCDLHVMKTLMDFVPEETQLHLANSSVIRYALLFDPIQSIQYWCNRGASGIDGSTSTAIGSAYRLANKQHVLVTGDLSFYYDSNGLWQTKLPANLIIVLINNGGGDIFNYIPGPSSTNQLKKIFVAEHRNHVKSLAEQFGLSYFYASTHTELDEAMEALFVNNSEKMKILEVNTMEGDNSKELNDYFRKFLTSN